jgi:hypothetical protein
MTASKSSRARNARAQANAARSRTVATARGNESGQAVKAGSAAVKATSAVAVKTGAAVKSNGRNGAGPTRAVAARNGGLARGSRAQVAQLEPTDDGSATRSAVPLWMQIATFLLALAGLGVSIYLTIAHFTEAPLAGCSESGLVNCTKVTTSPQSYVFGIPVAVLGLLRGRGRPHEPVGLAGVPARDPSGPYGVAGGRRRFRALPALRGAVHYREHLPVLHQRARHHVRAVRAHRVRRGGLGNRARAAARLTFPARLTASRGQPAGMI